MRILVCMKQVPDTTDIKIDPKTNTLKRDGVPSNMNPDDKTALEVALRLKDEYGAEIAVISMGPPQAEIMLREALAMGADEAYLMTDRAFAGSDTLATSTIIAAGIKKVGCDFVIGGRQAIDGDTAQVGPQVAEKLHLPQVTYAEQILSVENGTVTVKRRLERGVETVKVQMPVVITVNGSADECRPRNAKLIQRYKYAKTPSEKQGMDAECLKLYEERPYLNLYEWSVSDVDADLQQVGLAGSPTKVKAVENVVFQAKESKQLSGNDNEIEELIKELIANHTIG